jgi:hypothetical protein
VVEIRLDVVCYSNPKNLRHQLRGREDAVSRSTWPDGVSVPSDSSATVSRPRGASRGLSSSGTRCISPAMMGAQPGSRPGSRAEGVAAVKGASGPAPHGPSTPAGGPLVSAPNACPCRNWTKDQRDLETFEKRTRTLALYLAGKTTPEIAEEVGQTQPNIKSALDEFRVRNGKLSEIYTILTSTKAEGKSGQNVHSKPEDKTVSRVALCGGHDVGTHGSHSAERARFEGSSMWRTRGFTWV